MLLVADKNKPSLQRVAKYSKNFPHATLTALAELLALKEPPARPGYPIIEDKKLPAQQRARDKIWRTLLQTLMSIGPAATTGSRSDAVVKYSSQGSAEELFIGAAQTGY